MREHGMAYRTRVLRSRSRHSSRGSNAPPGRTRRSSTGQRVAGGVVLDGGGVRGHEMYKPSLCPNAREQSSGKRHAGKLARVVWEGGDGQGVICTTSPAPYFISEGGGWKRVRVR